MMFIKHYAPNRCLCIKVANSIDHWVEDCRDVTKAGGGGTCTKNGSYCEKENQRTNGPINAHLISWPSKAQNIQNLENIW